MSQDIIWKYTSNELTMLVNNFITNSKKRMQNITNDNPKNTLMLLNEDINEYLYISSLLNFLTIITKNIMYTDSLKKINIYINKINSDKTLFSKIYDCYKKGKYMDEDLLFMQKVVNGYEKVGINIDNILDISSSIFECEKKLSINVPQVNLNNSNKNIRKNKEEQYYKNFTQYISKMNDNILLKHKYALLRGDKSFSDYTNKYNLSKTSENINKFLYNLLLCIEEKYLIEYESLIALNNNNPLNSWDIDYLLDIYKKKHNPDINVEEYFPLDNTLKHIFGVFGDIFGISVESNNNNNLWNKSVKKYTLSINEHILGVFYFDFFNNYNIDKCFMVPSSIYYSILIKNLKSPYLKMGEIISIVHDFTHIVQYFISANSCKYNFLNIMNNEIDFIKIPSFIMEYIFWTPGIIKKISGHYKTNNKLDDDTINKLIYLRDVTLGFDLKKHITIAFYDQVIYSSDELINICNEGKNQNVFNKVFDKINKLISPEINIQEYILYPGIPLNYFFGCNAVYYSYLWNKVHAAEIYSNINNFNDLKMALKKLLNNTFKKGEISLEGFIKLHNIPNIKSENYTNHYTEN